MDAITRDRLLKAKTRLITCPYRRNIVFTDSLMFIQSSLAKMIDDLHIASDKEAIPLSQSFSCSKRYCDTVGFTTEQFERFIKNKLPIPYEFCTDYLSMVNQTTIPVRSSFRSILRGIEEITIEEHADFSAAWHDLGCANLLDLMLVYSVADVTMYADSVAFLFEKMYSLTNIYPSNVMTVSTLSVQSLLYNARLVGSPNRRLWLPYLSSSEYELIAGTLVIPMLLLYVFPLSFSYTITLLYTLPYPDNMLCGGYAVNSAYYSKMNFGFDPPAQRDDLEEGEEEDKLGHQGGYASGVSQQGGDASGVSQPESDTLTAGLFMDFNSLYPSSLLGEQ